MDRAGFEPAAFRSSGHAIISIVGLQTGRSSAWRFSPATVYQAELPAHAENGVSSRRLLKACLPKLEIGGAAGGTFPPF